VSTNTVTRLDRSVLAPRTAADDVPATWFCGDVRTLTLGVIARATISADHLPQCAALAYAMRPRPSTGVMGR